MIYDESIIKEDIKKLERRARAEEKKLIQQSGKLSVD